MVKIILVLCALSIPANAATLKEGLALYESKDLERAAAVFYDVIHRSSVQDERDQAEIYLAETMRDLDLLVPAMFYYTDLFRAGRGNRYYLNAVEGLLAVHRRMRDPLWVPALINEFLDPEGFGQLEPDRIWQINYIVGELSFRQGKNMDARAFLEFVPPENVYHPRARYLLGLLSVRGGDQQAAMNHFRAVLDLVEKGDRETIRLRALTHLALARTAFGIGKWAEAIEHFAEAGSHPQFAMVARVESGWAHFQADDRASALGAVAGASLPEASVIAATTWFVNCQWQLAITATEETDAGVAKAVSSYLATKRDPSAYYRDLLASRLPPAVTSELRKLRRFHVYHWMITQMDMEKWRVETTDAWRGSRLAEDLLTIIQQHRESTASVAGTWVQRQLEQSLAMAEHFTKARETVRKEAVAAEALWRSRGVDPVNRDAVGGIANACLDAKADTHAERAEAGESLVQVRDNFLFELERSAQQL